MTIAVFRSFFLFLFHFPLSPFRTHTVSLYSLFLLFAVVFVLFYKPRMIECERSSVRRPFAVESSRALLSPNNNALLLCLLMCLHSKLILWRVAARLKEEVEWAELMAPISHWFSVFQISCAMCVFLEIIIHFCTSSFFFFNFPVGLQGCYWYLLVSERQCVLQQDYSSVLKLFLKLKLLFSWFDNTSFSLNSGNIFSPFLVLPQYIYISMPDDLIRRVTRKGERINFLLSFSPAAVSRFFLPSH